jgi:uncharacterized Tic20 family protein
MPSQDDRLMAAVAHLSFFVGFWLVGPIAFYVVKRKESRFVAFHAMQALVAHVLSMAFGIFGVIVFAVGMGIAGVTAQREPAALVVMLVLLLVFGAFGVGVAVINAVAAYKAWVGEMWSIPVAGRIAHGIMGADVG